MKFSWWFLVLVCLALHARGQALDALISGTDLWETRGDFVDQHRDLGFYWLSNSKDRAETHAKGLTLFSGTVYEVDAEFQGDKLNGLTISIYNRGDAGAIERDRMTALFQSSYAQLTALTKVQPVTQGQDAADAVKTFGWSWQTPTSRFLLELSFTKEVKTRNIPFRAEFIRLRVTPPEKPKTFLAAALASASPPGVFNGLAHVKKDGSGDVRIETVPMVDQGRKGYCVVATAERVMRYYGVPVDEHELAELANSSSTAGTSNEAMFDSLKKLSQRLRVKIRTIETMDVRQILDLMKEYNKRAKRGHRAPEIPDQGQMLDMQAIYTAMQPAILKETRTRNKADVDRFQQTVQDHIDQGIPVLWSVMLGLVPETNGAKGIGGHMRLIIGYNTGTNEILYSDSWGPGHELKRMAADDAWTITTALNTIEPL
jgi:hypothetical protein